MTQMSQFRSELLATYAHAGSSLVTVYVPTQSDRDDAVQRLDIHRSNITRALREAGASDAVVGVVEKELGALAHSEGQSHLLVANDQGVVFSAAMARPVAQARAFFAPVPVLVPLLGATQVDFRHIAALIDRSGADVMLRSGVNDPLDTFEIDGSHERLHRSAPGGWSQKRFQQAAENAWELNAREVIDEIIADYPDVDLVICGGDVRAVGFFTKHLPERIEAVVVDGSRQADADAFLDAADVALRDRAAGQQVALLDSFRTALANGNAVKGREVIDMLIQGRVSDLLVVDDSNKRTDTAPSIAFDFVANTKAADTNADNASTAPLVETAVAQAVRTDADVHVVADTSDTEDGLAAILRF